MPQDFSTIPALLVDITKDSPSRPWRLKQIGEMLQIAYNLLEHPIFKKREGYIDIFRKKMENAELYRRYNRTVIERIIHETQYYGNVEFEFGILTLRSEGIEFGLNNLKIILEIANELENAKDEELQLMGASLHYFQLTKQGEVFATLMYFLDVCQGLILNIRCTGWRLELKSIDSIKNKNEFLQRKKADLLQAQTMTDEKIYSGLMEWLSIEIDFIENTRDKFDGVTELKPLIEQFLAQQEAKITNDELLRHLVHSEIDPFCRKLSELVLQVFSYHDISGKEPEKVYHAFLLGILQGLNGQYRTLSNRESGLGRFDIIAIPNLPYDDGIIIEVKKLETNNKDQIEFALAKALLQIEENKYFIELKQNGVKQYIAIAAVFCGKELFTKWQIRNIETEQ